jgi:hypothetical protein
MVMANILLIVRGSHKVNALNSQRPTSNPQGRCPNRFWELGVGDWVLLERAVVERLARLDVASVQAAAQPRHALF